MQMHEISRSLRRLALMHPHDGFLESRHLELTQYIGQRPHVNTAKSLSLSARTTHCTAISNSGAPGDQINTQETNRYIYRTGFQSIITPEELNALRQLFEWMSHELIDEPVIAATDPHFSSSSV